MPRRSDCLGSVAEDQPLGHYPRSTCPLTRWCLVSRGNHHVLYHVGNRTLTFHCSASTDRQATPASSFPGLDFCHLGFPPISISKKASHNLPWRPPCLRHPLRCRHLSVAWAVAWAVTLKRAQRFHGCWGACATGKTKKRQGRMWDAQGKRRHRNAKAREAAETPGRRSGRAPSTLWCFVWPRDPEQA